MALIFTCPQGHRWESSADALQPGEDFAVACPVCGFGCNFGEAHETRLKPASGASSFVEEPLSVPTFDFGALPTIPGYEVISCIARGGMGVIYKARHVGLNRLVALKMILIGRHATAEQRLRFQIEAEALASLQHPNIVQVHDVGEHNCCPYLAMELVSGGTLAVHLQSGPLPPRAAAVLIASLARAVHAAHLRGIVHRDVKPLNVLIDMTDGGAPTSPSSAQTLADGLRNGTAIPKLTDFGLAKRLHEDRLVSEIGFAVGTPSYMAPEQFLGDPKYLSPAVDIFSLGVVLYESLTGKNPFGETGGSARSANAPGPPLPSPRQVCRSVPRDLDTICLKCMHENPARRYESAQQLADDVERFLADRPIQARRVGAPERVVKWCRRHPAWAVLCAMLSIVVPAALGLLVWTEAQVRASAQAAREGSELAREAVDDMYVQVAEEWLADEPFKDPLQQAFLEKAASIYARLGRQPGVDADVRQQTGRSLFRLGQIYQKLNLREEAAAAYLKAIALQEALHKDNALEAAYRQDLANSCNWLGELYREGSQPLEQIESLYLKAQTLQQQLADDAPEVAAYRKELARTHSNLGIIYLDSSRVADGTKELNIAVEMLEKVHADHPDAWDIRHELARTLINRGVAHNLMREPARAEADYRAALDHFGELQRLAPNKVVVKRDGALAGHDLGNLLFAQRRHKDAQAVLEPAQRLLQELADRYPTRPSYRADLARVLNSLGSVQAATGSNGDAENAWQHAIAVLRPLVEQHQDFVAYRQQLGEVLGNLAWLRSEPGDYDGASRLFVEAISHLRAGLKARPTDRPCLLALRNQFQNLAECRLRLKDAAGAAEAAERLAEVFPKLAQDQYYAACFLARSVPLAPDAAASARIAGRAVYYLRLAVDLDASQLTRIADEAAVFQAMREQPDIAKLLKRLPASPGSQ